MRRWLLLSTLLVARLRAEVHLARICTNQREFCDLHFESRDGKLWANSEEFRLKGLNWLGTESRNGAPYGLFPHNVEFYMEFAAQHQFNALRLPFHHKGVIDDSRADDTTVGLSPELGGLEYLEMLLTIAEEAAMKGILVMMAAQRLRPDAWPANGLWHDAETNEEAVMQSWSKVASRVCDQWNIFAVDIQHEPHASTWGTGKPTDWNRAAERIGNHILSLCPRLLIFVEGVGSTGVGAGFELWSGEVGITRAPSHSESERAILTPRLRATD